MLTLYEHTESPCCQKVRLTLAEKRIPYESVWIDIQVGDNLTESFLALNPKAQVPVLVHETNGEEFVLTESTIICTYLEDCFGEPPLFPGRPRERALARNWALMMDTSIHMPHTPALTFTIAFRELLLLMLDTSEKQNDYLESIKHPVNREVRKQMLSVGFESPYFYAALNAYDELFATMAAQLDSTEWLAGADFSHADIVVAPYVKRFLMLGLEERLRPYPLVTTWFEKLQQRESWRTEIAAKDAEFVAFFKEQSEGVWEREIKPRLSKWD